MNSDETSVQRRRLQVADACHQKCTGRHRLSHLFVYSVGGGDAVLNDYDLQTQ
jgi:hypothetical protein